MDMNNKELVIRTAFGDLVARLYDDGGENPGIMVFLRNEQGNTLSLCNVFDDSQAPGTLDAPALHMEVYADPSREEYTRQYTITQADVQSEAAWV